MYYFDFFFSDKEACDCIFERNHQQVSEIRRNLRRSLVEYKQKNQTKQNCKAVKNLYYFEFFSDLHDKFVKTTLKT